MRNIPQDASDREDLERLNAEPWQVDALSYNPDYTSWGNYEDYMGDHNPGWSSPVERDTWKEMDFNLNDLNEVVNFYFEIVRDSVVCPHCDGEGYNLPTLKISRDFYDFANTGNRWCDRITQDEVDALIAKGRLYQFKGNEPVTAERVNAAERQSSGVHDAINRWILIETRARRLGVWGQCPHCEGHGHIFTAPAAHLALQLWVLHPRKGAARGVYVKTIEQADLPAVIAYLRRAADRNASRFGRLPSPQFVG